MSEPTAAAPRTGHAPVNGMRMYYEVHEPEVHEPDRDPGTVPVLLLHGAYMPTGNFGPLLPGLATPPDHARRELDQMHLVTLATNAGPGRPTHHDHPRPADPAPRPRLPEPPRFPDFTLPDSR